MKISWKGIAILAVLVVAALYDYPTFKAFMPEDREAVKSEIQQRMETIKNTHTPLSQIKLAFVSADKKKIQLLTEESFVYPENNTILNELLGDNFTYQKDDMGQFLILKKGHDEDVFVSEVSGKLNGILDRIKKVDTIALGENDRSIIFQMKKNKRLSPIEEPLKTYLGDDLEVSYKENLNTYVTRPVKNENVVSLGLDLQGGMYLDIGVKVDDVIAAVTDKLSEELENYMIDDSINYESVEKVSQESIEIILDVDEKFELTDEKYTRIIDRNYDVAPTDNGYVLTMKAEEVARIKKRAIEQALETIRNRIDQLGVKEPTIQQQGENSIVIQLPGLKDPDQARRVIGTVAVLQFMLVAEEGSVDNPGKDQVVLYQENRDPITKEVLSSRPVLLEKKVIMKGDTIRDSRVAFLQSTGAAYVTMSFDDTGKRQFAEVTKSSTGRQLAIVLDGKVQSAPRINEPITGGEAQITGNFSPEEASELALVLRSGALPAPIIIQEERTVGASLGEDSIRQSLIALCLGFALVILFMIVYYQVSGVFSVLALIFNLLLIVAALAYFQATLTLPGIAGIILTIGMAVDANVLIFERIREEINAGSPVRTAVAIGFKKATVTILDSNITTILAAIVLFQFGTGPIKGFAVTLSIGIAASMFTSIVVGKLLFQLVYLRRSRLEKISI